MSQVTNNKHRLFKQWILIVLSVFVTLLLIITLLFNYYKDDIAKEVLLSVNKIQKGELTFDDISFNPFVHFPNVSLSLNSITYYEFPATQRVTDSIPIIELDNIYIAFDVFDLIVGNISVSDVMLKNGSLRLITVADGSLNIINAIGMEADTSQNSNDDYVKNTNPDFNLDIDIVKLRNINISYEQTKKNIYSSFNIHSVDASFNYSSDTIMCSVTSNITVAEINLDNSFLLSNKLLNFNISITYNRNSSRLQVNPSKFTFDKANFATTGYVDLSGDGYIDMEVSGGDKDLSILNLFIDNNIVEDIKQGNLHFNGTVKGGLTNGIPQIKCSFGIADVEIEIPKTNRSINQLGLSGYFNSGVVADFSEAQLEINNIEAKLSGGSLDGRMSVKDFSKPSFNINYNMKTNLDGFEEFFNFTMLDSIKGSLEVTSNLSGEYDIHSKQIANKTGSSRIQCNNISFVVPGVNRVKYLDGVIKFDPDSLFIEELEIEIGTSDFKISGYLTNLMYLLFNTDKNIEGKLSIASNTYDFPDFFSYDPRVANSFPFKFKDVSIDVGIATSTTKLVDFKIVPNIDFNILHLDAVIEDFLPPITINSGIFNLAEIDTALNLDFSNFNISMAGSELNADVVYNSPRVNPDWLIVNVDVSNFNPQKAFVNWFSDSIPSFLTGNIDGAMYLNLVFSLDSIDFDKVDFVVEKLTFVNPDDTIDVHQLELKAIYVDYDLTSSNILETLICEASLNITNLSTNKFKVDELDYDIKVKNGTYYVRPNNTHLFNKHGDGLFVIKPFGDHPVYNLRYKVDQFDIANLFSTFLSDTLLVGKMDLDFAITFTGNNRKDIEQTLDGRLMIRGKDLTLKGLDLDKVIDRFKRSQRFTLADVGAVALMGPVGILVTKGSDYASLIVLSPGESCEVVEFLSDWEVEKGLVNLVDVAFTTNENRMAIKGQVNLLSDSLNIEIGLLNEKGCSIYSQSISGDVNNPDMGKVKVVRSVLAPVTDLVNKVGEVKCDVFYSGKVKQPNK